MQDAEITRAQKKENLRSWNINSRIVHARNRLAKAMEILQGLELVNDSDKKERAFSTAKEFILKSIND